MLSRIFTLAALAATTLADATPILDALALIQSDTTALQTTVASWDGGILGTVPILHASTQLLCAINKGTKQASAADPLDVAGAVQVATAVQGLAGSVNGTLETLIGRKGDFDRLLLVSPVILLNLEMEKDATDDFSAAVVSKVPESLQAVGESLAEGIDESFDKAIDAYQLF